VKVHGYSTFLQLLSEESAQAFRDQALNAGEGELGDRGHWERTADGSVRLCRIERFTEVLPGGSAILTVAAAAARARTSKDLVLMKDKLNIKWPGGGGYRCHQDRRAYPPEMYDVLTVGIALTPSDPANGGLYLADGVAGLLPADERGCVAADAMDRLSFDCPELRPGDAVIFDGDVPHYSGPNSSDGPRMLALLTFLPHSAADYPGGDPREHYYNWRRAILEAGSGPALSTISDFSGELVSERPAP
jgi:ectoine hydroxylase-related dioxygenase (phytanoyl-CoA dioxygenase family)